MRSLIKSHRRSDSSTSEGSPSELPSKAAAKATPLSSPLVGQYPQFTPPQAVPSQTMSSPKKLLTPIKKMFGHHSRATPLLPSTTDSLAFAMSGDFEPPSGRKNIRRGPSSFTSLLELHKGALLLSLPRKLHGLALMNFTEPERARPPQKPLQSSSESSVDLAPRKHKIAEDMPIIFDPKLLSLRLRVNDSNPLIAASEGNFRAKEDRKDTEAVYEADDDLKDSDALSQFSFVKDICGGRNTSVKYYKTKLAPRPKYFTVEDLGLENDALLDYDFENNGLDDDDDYDDFDSNNRFGDFLETAEPRAESSDLIQHTDSMKGVSSPYGEDLLDSYLDKTKLPQSEPCGNFLGLPAGDSDSPSPLMNGITFGSESRLRSMRSTRSSDTPADAGQVGLGILLDPITVPAPVTPPLAPAETVESPRVAPSPKPLLSASPLAQKRNSIAAMMDLLSTLEDLPKESDDALSGMKTILRKLSTEDADVNYRRNLVVDMMNTLALLETSNDKVALEPKKAARKSIADMMSTLAALDSVGMQSDDRSAKSGPEKAAAPQRASTVPAVKPRSGRRYSWFNIEEDGGLKGDVKSAFEDISTQLDEDLLDEVNLLPEDYDFNEHESASHDSEEPSFIRSNSYNKKPLKTVKDYSYQKNTIETSLKTLTFYRTNSMNSSGQDRSTSRTGSVKSATSMTSVNDDDADEHAFLRAKLAPYGHHINTSLHALSGDSISKKSANLEPITESESPLL